MIKITEADIGRKLKFRGVGFKVIYTIIKIDGEMVVMKPDFRALNLGYDRYSLKATEKAVEYVDDEKKAVEYVDDEKKTADNKNSNNKTYRIQCDAVEYKGQLKLHIRMKGFHLATIPERNIPLDLLNQIKE